MSKEINKYKSQLPFSNLPRPVSLQDVENPDGVWKTIIKRFPNTAPLLHEMEEVIDRAESILLNFKSVSQTEAPRKFANSIQESASIKCQSHTNTIARGCTDEKQLFIDGKSEHKILQKCSHGNTSLQEWEEFGNSGGIDHFSYSSYFNDSSSALMMSLSPLSVNNSSGNIVHQLDSDLKRDESLKKITTLNEVENSDIRSLNDITTQYKNIFITKGAVQLQKSTELLHQKKILNEKSASPIITIREAVLSPISVQVSKYDDKVGSFKSSHSSNEDQTHEQRQHKHEAENGAATTSMTTALVKNKVSPRQNSASPRATKPSSIPRKIDGFRSKKNAKKIDSPKESPKSPKSLTSSEK